MTTDKSGKGISMTGFPVSDLKSGDIAKSWRQFTNEFQLGVRLKTLKLGRETINISGVDAQLPRFNEEAKLMALLKAVGQEGRDSVI